MALHGILKNKNNELWWLEEATVSELMDYKDNLLYVADDWHKSGLHSCFKSALYDDMTGYKDLIQLEDDLNDDEFYVVLYHGIDSEGLTCEVDFGVTKNGIVQNVLDNKYVEGAYYYTVGQMMKTTWDYQNGAYNG